MKKIFKIAKIPLLILFSFYIALNIILYNAQKEMVYFPNEKDFFECKNFKTSEIKEYKNTRFYEVSWEKNNVIVFFHWNAWSACDRTFTLNLLKQTWNTIIFVEYFWYSEKENNPNIKEILNNSQEIWEYIKLKNFEKTYVMWRSLWTWPASFFAKNFEANKLLLISPYSQLYKVAMLQYPLLPVYLLFTENYENEKYLKKYSWDLLIIHWKKDKVVPYSLWMKLHKSLKENNNKKFVSKEEWTHHNILDFSDIKKEIIVFLNEE